MRMSLFDSPRRRRIIAIIAHLKSALALNPSVLSYQTQRGVAGALARSRAGRCCCAGGRPQLFACDQRIMINMMTMIDATCRHLSCSSPIRLPRRHILSPAAVAAFVLLAWLIGCVSGIRNDPFVAFAPLPSPRRANDAIGRISRPRTCSQSQPSTTSRCPVSRTQPIYATSTQLSLARYDNLVSGVAEISIGFALGVLWSEYAVITTGCGPLNFSDALERICYQGVILSAGASLFTRIVSGGTDLTTYICEDYYGGLLAESTVVQVRTAEWLSILAVIGAFVSLGFQIANGEQMDGLSGINVEMCRAVRDL